MQGHTDNDNDSQRNSIVCSSAVSFCPSFNSYASGRTVDIASKVGQEAERQHENGAGEDFEFVSNGKVGSDTCELFVDGQIRQVFPIFNRALLLNEEEEEGYDDRTPRNLRVSLRNLFIEERGGVVPPSSPSSSEDEEEEEEVDELEGVPKGTYCIWSPNRKAVTASPNRSNSTGSTSSKGWFKFRDLLKLKRSNSEGKDPFVLVHKKKTNNNADSKAQAAKQPQQGSNDHVHKRGGGKVKLSPIHESFYMSNKATKEVDHHKKRASYLPYKQDLLGFFVSNVASIGKSFAPF